MTKQLSAGVGRQVYDSRPVGMVRSMSPPLFHGRISAPIGHIKELAIQETACQEVRVSHGHPETKFPADATNGIPCQNVGSPTRAPRDKVSGRRDDGKACQEVRVLRPGMTIYWMTGSKRPVWSTRTYLWEWVRWGGSFGMFSQHDSPVSRFPGIVIACRPSLKGEPSWHRMACRPSLKGEPSWHRMACRSWIGMTVGA